MVKIRSEIPALVKRAYSEDVNYDFIKIDDIFRYLTPAMNRWNVNFEIVSESASKRNENGDPVYVEFLAYCQMWLYEADLELKWINAEKPEDEVTVTIHAIGTHEMPEKAKGSALTYAMKYYLMDKYCIDQGGVDPDMRDFPPDTYDGSIPENDGLSSDAYDFSDRDSEGIAGDASGITDMELDAEMEGGQEVPDELPEEEPMEGAEESEADASEERSMMNDSEMNPESGQEETDAEETAKQQDGGMESDAKKTRRKSAKDKQKADKGDTNRPVLSRHIMPENGTMVNLPNEVSPQPAVNMTIEEAGNIVCTFGIYNNKCLSELLNQGEEGVKALEWIAYNYRGRNETIRQGARLLLSTL